MSSTFRARRYNFDWRSFITPGVKLLVLVCAGVFLVQTVVSLIASPLFAYHYLTQVFGLVPSAITHGLRIWQPLTYIFLHCGVGAGLIEVIIKTIPVFFGRPPSDIPTIGASGAIFGILIANAILFPDRRIW